MMVILCNKLDQVHICVFSCFCPEQKPSPFGSLQNRASEFPLKCKMWCFQLFIVLIVHIYHYHYQCNFVSSYYTAAHPPLLSDAKEMLNTKCIHLLWPCWWYRPQRSLPLCIQLPGSQPAIVLQVNRQKTEFCHEKSLSYKFSFTSLYGIFIIFIYIHF